MRKHYRSGTSSPGTRARIVGVVGLSLAVLVTYTSLTHAYVPVWRSNLALWSYAVAQAPLKPRPRVELGLALLRLNRLEDAEICFRQAEHLALQPHVPIWDRNETLRATAHDRAILEILRAQRRAADQVLTWPWR